MRSVASNGHMCPCVPSQATTSAAQPLQRVHPSLDADDRHPLWLAHQVTAPLTISGGTTGSRLPYISMIGTGRLDGQPLSSSAPATGATEARRSESWIPRRTMSKTQYG